MSEYTYDIDKYTIGVDENGEDGIGMTVAKIENGGIKFLGNCYGENARCIDLLIKENQELKKQLEENKHKGLYNTCLPYSTGYNKAIKEKENQQKCFIEYLEEQIKDMEEEIGNSITKPYKESHVIRKNVYQEILSKYKSIIGGKDE